MTKAEITSWSRIENGTTGSREIYAGRVEGLKFGAIATIEKTQDGFILMIDRGDRRRRTFAILETMDHAQAAAASLIAK